MSLGSISTNNGSPRVLLCSRSTTLGGVELRMALEARFLKRIGYAPAIAINMHPPLQEWAEGLVQENIPVLDFDPPPFMERWRWGYINKFRAKYFSGRILRHLNPELIHVFLPWTDWGGTRLWLAHHYGIPTVISVRNSFRGGSELWPPWHTRHYKEAFRSVRGVYAISPSALRCFHNIFGRFLRPNTMTEVIYNGVDTKRFEVGIDSRAEARKKLGLPRESLVMGTVGRLEGQKQPESILSVFAELKRRFPALHLVFVGSGTLEQKVRRQAEQLGVAQSVVLTGFQDRVERLLPAFDFFVMFSTVEGFGTATAEAMASGLPVVGTDVPGTHDILSKSNAGILVPLNDQQKTVEACARLLTNEKLRKEMGTVAKEEAVQKYDIKDWENRILEFYEHALHKSNGGSS
jgi:glycosyltransferase involved in cell wall biosynthesis